MDRTYSTNISDFGKEVIQIGRVGENQFRAISVDCSAWLTDYPSGSLALIFKAPSGETYMPSNVTISAGVLTWVPETVDLQTEGVGAAQIELLDGDTVALSSVAPVLVCNSLTDVGEVPTPSESWLVDMIAASLAAQNAAESASDDAERADAAADRAEQAESDVEHGLAAKADKTYVDDQLALKLDADNGNATGTLNVANEKVRGRLVVINAVGNGGMLRGYTASSTKGLMLRVLEEGDDPSSPSSGTEIINFRKASVLFTVPIYMSNARIRNLAPPSTNTDAANMKYVLDQCDAAKDYANTVAAGKVTNNGSSGNVIVYPSAENAKAEIINVSGGNSFFRVNRGALGVPATAEMNSGSGVINANSCRLGSVADPQNAQDAATKAYVDAQIQAIRTELGI